MKRKHKIYLCLVITLLSLNKIEQACAAQIIKLKKDTFLKENNSKSSNIIAYISKESEVHELTRTGDWILVNYNGLVGYIEKDLPENLSLKSIKNVLEVSSTKIKDLKQNSTYSFSPSIVPSSLKNDKQNLSTKSRASSVTFPQWEEVKSFLPLHKDIEVFDILSGKTYNVRCFSKGNHADVETSTKQDTSIMLETFEGKWSWDVRPVWITVNGVSIASSINGMPHAKGVIDDNNMDGQVCIHFLGSKTHNGNQDYTKLHQEVAIEAYDIAKKNK